MIWRSKLKVLIYWLSLGGVIYLCCFGFALFKNLGRPGADLPEYVSWADVFADGNIFHLSRKTISPNNVPVSQWSHGIGLIISVGARFFSQTPIHFAAQSLVYLNLATLFFCAIILWNVSKRSLALTILGIVLLLAATQYGYYAYAASSEIYSILLLSAAGAWLSHRRKFYLLDGIVLGGLCYLFILARSQHIIYMLPLGVTLLIFMIRQNGGMSNVALLSKKNFFALLLLTTPILLAIAQISIVNKWMTNSIFVSAYQYGDETFKSLDLSRPEILATLIHPWHGLLSYHPFFLISFICSIAVLIKIKGWQGKAIVSSILLACLCHFYISASWWVWWLGTGTFGMRGLIVFAIIFVAFFVHYLACSKNSLFWVILLVTLATLCGFYSLTLLGGQPARQILSFTHLCNHVKDTLHLIFYLPPINGIRNSAIMLVCFLFYREAMGYKSFSKDAFLILVAFLLLLLYALIHSVTIQKTDLLFLSVLFGISASVSLGFAERYATAPPKIAVPVALKKLSYGLVITLSLYLMLFTNLAFFSAARKTNAHIEKTKNRPILKKDTYYGRMNFREAIDSRYEYQYLTKGFTLKQQQLDMFLLKSLLSQPSEARRDNKRIDEDIQALTESIARREEQLEQGKVEHWLFGGYTKDKQNHLEKKRGQKRGQSLNIDISD